MGVLFFIIITFAFVILPLMPAISEWARPTDKKPLKIVQEFDSDTSHFANGFKEYINKNFRDLFSIALQAGEGADVPAGGQQEDVLKDRTGFVFSYNQNIALNSAEILAKQTNRLLLGAGNLQLSDGISYNKEIYGGNSITSGKKNNIRAIFAEGDIFLQEGSNIIRWVHAGKNLAVGNGCTLYGRASAENSIVLSSPCVFERMRAPFIQFGGYVEKPFSKRPSNIAINELVSLNRLGNVKEQDGKRWLVSGDLIIPPHTLFSGDIITTGNIKIGAGSVVYGSIKSNGALQVLESVEVHGSLVGAGNISIGDYSKIHGPIIAEGSLVIGRGTVIGSEDKLTSVNAPGISCHSGVCLYGTIWAYDRGVLLNEGIPS